MNSSDGISATNTATSNSNSPKGPPPQAANEPSVPLPDDLFPKLLDSIFPVSTCEIELERLRKMTAENDKQTIATAFDEKICQWSEQIRTGATSEKIIEKIDSLVKQGYSVPGILTIMNPVIMTQKVLGKSFSKAIADFFTKYDLQELESLMNVLVSKHISSFRRSPSHLDQPVYLVPREFHWIQSISPQPNYRGVTIYLFEGEA
jgi:hypothetical protein